MNLVVNGYLFSKKERQMIPILCYMLSFLLIILGIVTYVFSIMPYRVFEIYAVAILLSLVYLAIDHMRHKNYRDARYYVSEASISLRFGDATIAIDSCDDYYISVLQLFSSSGKAYAYHPYIVLWTGSIPSNEVHPFELIKRKCILLPCSEKVLCQLSQFLNHSEIPNYPKVLHHVKNLQTNQTLYMES